MLVMSHYHEPNVRKKEFLQKRLKVIEPIMVKYSDGVGVDDNICKIK